ncbi:MAG: hypothetical protein BWY88_00674 [Synergistetes bacterium ADurb.Bin520]|nr:MAG: hypothetical protein BWY88_00674 [Synergistetes bacterium ADurb.Bin520]
MVGMRRPRKITSPSPKRVMAMWDRGQRSPLAPTEPWHGITG